MMLTRLTLIFATAFLGHAMARAQTSAVQIEQARGRTRLSADAAGSMTGFADFPDIPSEPAESDASGVPAMARGKDAAQAFTGFAEIAAFATNNVALSRKAKEDDQYLVATTGATFSRQLCPQLQATASVRASGYRYNRFPGLDFHTIESSLGVTWIPPKLGRAEVTLQYTFSDFTTRHGDEFFTDHAILLGMQKEYAIGRAQAMYAGWSGQWGWSDPKSAHRDEYSVFAGYRLQATRSLDADLYYRYSRYVYAESAGRQDNNQIVSLTWRYAPLDWAAVSLTSYYSWNRSTRSAFNYDALNAGVALQFSIRF